MYFDDGQDDSHEMMIVIPTRRSINHLPPKTRFLMSESQQAAMTTYKRHLEKQPRMDLRRRYDESTVEQLSGGGNNSGISRVTLLNEKINVVVKGIPDTDFRSVYEPFILQVGLGPHPNIVRLREVFYAYSRREIVLEFESCTRTLLDYLLDNDITPEHQSGDHPAAEWRAIPAREAGYPL